VQYCDIDYDDMDYSNEKGPKKVETVKTPTRTPPAVQPRPVNWKLNERDSACVLDFVQYETKCRDAPLVYVAVEMADTPFKITV
jgi:hypothetical protein